MITEARIVSDWQDKVVRHFKGDKYIVEDIAEHTETGEGMVIYRALYSPYTLYARPLNMFLEPCTPEQYEKYGQEYRFERVNVPSVKR